MNENLILTPPPPQQKKKKRKTIKKEKEEIEKKERLGIGERKCGGLFSSDHMDHRSGQHWPEKPSKSLPRKKYLGGNSLIIFSFSFFLLINCISKGSTLLEATRRIVCIHKKVLPPFQKECFLFLVCPRKNDPFQSVPDRMTPYLFWQYFNSSFPHGMFNTTRLKGIFVHSTLL